MCQIDTQLRLIKKLKTKLKSTKKESVRELIEENIADAEIKLKQQINKNPEDLL